MLPKTRSRPARISTRPGRAWPTCSKTRPTEPTKRFGSHSTMPSRDSTSRATKSSISSSPTTRPPSSTSPRRCLKRPKASTPWKRHPTGGGACGRNTAGNTPTTSTGYAPTSTTAAPISSTAGVSPMPTRSSMPTSAAPSSRSSANTITPRPTRCCPKPPIMPPTAAT